MNFQYNYRELNKSQLKVEMFMLPITEGKKVSRWGAIKTMFIISVKFHFWEIH